MTMKIDHVKGLIIRTADGIEFDVMGEVSYEDYEDCGRVYYCCGASWLWEIVTGMFEKEE